MSSHNVTVIKAFGKYRVGQTITDPTEVAAILSGPKRHNVNRTLARHVPAASAPAAEPVVDAAAEPVAHEEQPAAE